MHEAEDHGSNSAQAQTPFSAKGHFQSNPKITLFIDALFTAWRCQAATSQLHSINLWYCLPTSHHTLTCLHPLGSSDDGWNHCPPGIAVIMQTVCCSQCVCAWSAGAQPAHAQCTALQHASYQCVMYNMLVVAPWGMTPARGEGFLLRSM